ncbi:S8/S53 family peptidase [Longimicrobium sp.]|jgi:subtilisin family serine protease|uniref:S8/S53 family peptidase n=1 Tax=Longimicrobium sp. TaxID=2029185 RepID=UPI002F94530D
MHNRFTPAVLAAALGALAACSDADQPVAPDVQPVLGRSGQPVPTRQEQRAGTFIELSDAQLWTAVQEGGGRVMVGLKAPGGARGVWQGKVLVDRGTWTQGSAAVLAQPGVQLIEADDLLPRVQVRVSDAGALSTIRKLPMVDYVEPVLVAGDLHAFAGTGGCGYGGAWTGDRQYTATSDIYSQKFTGMNIPSAWTLSAGAGMTIGLIDTGLSSGQRQFTSTFATGSSTGRTIRFMKVASQPSVYDDCGHGTRMAGIIAAPWDGRSVGGIAYKANLISVRQASGVAAVSSADAAESVRIAASNGSRVIVMAWESLNWWWQVSDEIEYWHYNRPILFLGAAGTSGCGDGILDSNVVFPADMPEVMAVTGITYPGGGVPCGIHRGEDVEITAYLDVPSTGQYTADVVTMGGSSNATAVVGSIAALVWSRTPTLTRDQVRARIQQSGAFYPSRHSEQGYGLINALKAVRGY